MSCRGRDLWPSDLELLKHFGCHAFKLHTKFERNRIIHGWFIDDLTRFRVQFWELGYNWESFLRDAWNLTSPNLARKMELIRGRRNSKLTLLCIRCRRKGINYELKWYEFYTRVLMFSTIPCCGYAVWSAGTNCGQRQPCVQAFRFITVNTAGRVSGQ